MFTENNFIEVTEIAGDEVAPHQVERSVHRYSWASEFCHDKDVLEIACGSGQGANILADQASSYIGLDYCTELVRKAQLINPELTFKEGDACQLPFEDNSKDVIVFFEAIYYIKDTKQLIKECHRVLREDGKILITSTNKDLFDFHKSNYSHKYFGADEYNSLVDQYGMLVEIFGYDDLSKKSFVSKTVRSIKCLAEKLSLIPKSMNGKKWLKKLVYGDLVQMPSSLSRSYEKNIHNKLLNISSDRKDYKHAFLYVVIKKKDKK